MSVKADTRQMVQFGHALRSLSKTNLRYAMQGVVNDQAFHGRKETWPEQAQSGLVLRNQGTVRSFGVTKASGRTVQAHLGSGRAYMATLEGGDTQAAKGEGVPIPAAAPGVRGTKPHQAAAMNRMGNLTTSKLSLRGNQRQRNAIVLAHARAHGGGVGYLKLESGRAGLFRIRGGSARKSKAMPRKLWDLSKRTVTIPSHKTLQPTAQIELRRSPIYWVSHLKKQLEFSRLKGRLKKR